MLFNLTPLWFLFAIVLVLSTTCTHTHYLCHHLRTTHGLSVDFCVLNVLGYVCYTIYCTNFYFNKNIIEEYKDRMSALDNDSSAQVTVQGNDVAFAVHAVIMASVTLSQIGIYDTFDVRPPSRRVFVILAFALLYCVVYLVMPRSMWLN